MASQTMNTNTQKTFVNSMWFEEKTFNDGGSILKVDINAKDMVDFLKQHKNDKGYVKIVISKRKTPGEKGQTHYAYLDTWQPSTSVKTQGVKTPQKAAVKTEQEAESLI